MNDKISITLKAFILCLLLSSIWTSTVILVTSLLSKKGNYIQNLYTVPESARYLDPGFSETPKKTKDLTNNKK